MAGNQPPAVAGLQPCAESGLRHAGELRVLVEGVVAGLLWAAGEAGRVDKGAGGGVLGGDSELAGVAERVLARSALEHSFEGGVARVRRLGLLFLLLGLLLLLGLESGLLRLELLLLLGLLLLLLEVVEGLLRLLLEGGELVLPLLLGERAETWGGGGALW